jgi:hypothetical protein
MSSESEVILAREIEDDRYDVAWSESLKPWAKDEVKARESDFLTKPSVGKLVPIQANKMRSGGLDH